MLLQFLKLELKNSIKAVRKTIIGFIAVLLVLTVAIAAVSMYIGQKKAIDPLKAAVVMHDEDKLTKMVVRYVSKIDSISSISEFEYMDEEDAFSAFKSGAVDIVIDLPEDFYNDVNLGVNTPLNIYIGQKKGILTDLFAEVTTSGAGYVRTTEAAVYAFLDAASSGDYRLLISDAPLGDHIAMLYAGRIMHRLKIFDSIVVSEYGSLGAYQFYYMAFVMILLLYSGISFGYLYGSESVPVEDKLRVYGVGRGAVAVVKEIVMTLHLFAMSVVIYFGGLYVQKISDVRIYSFSPVHLSVFLGLSLSVAVLYNMLYSVTGDNYKAVPVIFLSMVMALLVSGLLVPYVKMHKAVYYAGRIIPFTYMREFFEYLFYDVPGSRTGCLILGVIVAAEQAVGVLWHRR